MEIFTSILDSISPILSAIIASFLTYVGVTKSKKYAQRAYNTKEAFKDNAEISRIYLNRLEENTDTIVKLREALILLKHDNGKKRLHIINLLDAAKLHITSCNFPDEEFKRIIEWTHDEYTKDNLR